MLLDYFYFFFPRRVTSTNLVYGCDMFQGQENCSASSILTNFGADPGVQEPIKNAISSTFSDLSANFSSEIESRISDLKRNLSEEHEASLCAKAKHFKKSEPGIKSRDNKAQFEHQQRVLQVDMSSLTRRRILWRAL